MCSWPSFACKREKCVRAGVVLCPRTMRQTKGKKKATDWAFITRLIHIRMCCRKARQGIERKKRNGEGAVAWLHTLE